MSARILFYGPMLVSHALFGRLLRRRLSPSSFCGGDFPPHWAWRSRDFGRSARVGTFTEVHWQLTKGSWGPFEVTVAFAC